MPKEEPRTSYTLIRNYTEKFEWTEPGTGIVRRGYNPPANAIDAHRVPFFISYITREGRMECGEVECISVNEKRHMRRVRFLKSQEIRWVYDYLIIEVDGVKFITH